MFYKRRTPTCGFFSEHGVASIAHGTLSDGGTPQGNELENTTEFHYSGSFKTICARCHEVKYVPKSVGRHRK